jgi:hypothetical protein
MKTFSRMFEKHLPTISLIALFFYIWAIMYVFMYFYFICLLGGCATNIIGTNYPTNISYLSE